MRAVGPLAIVLDFIEALLLSVVLFLISPIKTIKNTSHIKKIGLGVKVLSRAGVLSSTLRALIDLRMGRHDRAITILESAIAVVEDIHFDHPGPDSGLILEHLFSWITTLYLREAHIDDAVLTVIRANKCIGVTALPGVNELDVKTAHIVKAGIAAGRLLDENGSATFMVQAGELADKRKKSKPQKIQRSPARGKIIPFPVPQKP